MVLARKERLTKKEIKEVLEKGRGFQTNFFFIRFSQKEKGPNKFSVIISAKKIKKATQRNSIKRRLKNILRSELKNFCCHDIAILVQPPALAAKTGQLKEEVGKIEKLLTKRHEKSSH